MSLVDVDPVERVEKLRDEYERALEAAEARRLAYHEALLDLIERGGPHLHELAEDLGLLDRRLHQAALPAPPLPRRRRAWRGVAGLAAVVVLLAAAAGGLWLAQAPPFAPTVRVPRVLQLPETAAARLLRSAGLRVRVVSLRREIPPSLAHRVLGVSSPPGERVAKGSTVTIYVAVPRAGAPSAHS